MNWVDLVYDDTDSLMLKVALIILGDGTLKSTVY